MPAGVWLGMRLTMELSVTVTHCLLITQADPSSGVSPMPAGTPGRWQSQIQQLRDMGIQDEELMLRVLQATDGDIQAALELIFAGGPGL
ncbi:hypothetical protein CRUP_020803 [Coryphaenoides rupestris]|nr:hypothetical protein CRUP_020803 [Coryphaenoides rupestris]